MTLAPQALILRTVFEIHCTFKYITRSDDPAKWADLYDRFQEIEQLLGVKASPHLPDPTDADYERVAKCNPEWFKEGTITLNSVHWTAIKGMNLRTMAEAQHVDLLDDYKSLYKTQSKFTHASPLIRNLYRKGAGLQSIPDPSQVAQLTFLAMGYCMKTLEEGCIFFGIKYPQYDYCVIAQDMMEAMGRSRLDPKDFRR